jgi:hypothetical protein
MPEPPVLPEPWAMAATLNEMAAAATVLNNAYLMGFPPRFQAIDFACDIRNARAGPEFEISPRTRSVRQARMSKTDARPSCA